jgi:hypothetical protein
MKKIIATVCILLILSCPSDNDENQDPIQNPTFSLNYLLKKWQFDKVIYNDVRFDYAHHPNCMKDEFTFANQEVV